MSIEAMKQALEALKSFAPHNGVFWRNLHKEDAEIANVIASLRQAIEQAEKQEPVPWQGCDLDGMVEAFERVIEVHFFRKNPFHNPIDADAQMALRILRGFIPYMKQYTAPQPQREWVGLTDEEIDQGLLRSDYALQTAHAWLTGVVFAMTQLKEKNT